MTTIAQEVQDEKIIQYWNFNNRDYQKRKQPN